MEIYKYNIYKDPAVVGTYATNCHWWTNNDPFWHALHTKTGIYSILF
jgi:hypothetical protein